MTNHKVIYHIGLPKTGTTTIQHYLAEQQGTTFDAVLKNQNDFFEILNFIRGKIGISEIKPIKLNKTLIYSAEEIAVTWLRVTKTNYIYPDWQPITMLEVLDRLQQFHKIKFGLYTDVVVMIGRRDLYTLVPSWYAQFGRRHLPKNSTFLDLLNYIENNKSSYESKSIQKLIETKFHNVIVYRQEDLFRDKCTLIQDLSVYDVKLLVNDVRLNTRKRRVGYITRVNPIGKWASLIGKIIPKEIKKIIRKFIFSSKFQKTFAKKWIMTASEKKKLDELCKH